MRAEENPQQFWCDGCKEWHWATVLGGKIEISKSTALVKQKLCIECHQPTTGSIGQAGYYWPSLCQNCKDESDGVLNVSVKNLQYLVSKVFA